MQTMKDAVRTALLRTSAIVAVGVALGGASAAQAQATREASPSAGPVAASLDEVVVTAQKRTESAQRAAVAITAVAGADLARAGVTEVQGLTRLVPALVVQPSIGTATNFYIRGVGSFAANAFSDNPVAFNFAGIYVARPAAPLGTFYDLQRVEVLKGPQGTLYGRNASGGAINVIPNAPSTSGVSGDVTLEYGNSDSRRGLAVFNQPLGETMAIRIAGQVIKRDGFLSDGYDDDSGQAVRVSFLARPSERLSVTLIADWFHQGGQGGGGVLVPGALTLTAPHPSERIGPSDPRSLTALTAANPFLVTRGLAISPAGDGFIENRFWGLSANVEADLGPVTLTLLPAFRHSRPDFLSYNGGYRARVVEGAQQTSLEARISPTAPSRLTYVLGAFVFDEVQNAFNAFNQGLLLDTRFWVDARSQSAAIFGQAAYEVVEGGRIVAGARYTRDEKSMATVFNQRSNGVGPIQTFGGREAFDSFTYKLGFEYDAAAQSLLYGNVATGYKSGGFFIAPLDNTFRPEKLTAFTLGSKNRFFGNRFQANAEVFYWRYRDQQVNFVGGTRTGPTTTGIGLVTSNAGQSRMYGVELDFALQATADDMLTLNVQYLDAKYNDYRFVLLSPTGAPPRTTCRSRVSTSTTVAPPAGAFDVDCSGKPQINAPKWTANLTYERTFELSDDRKIVAGARLRLESGRFLATDYLPEQHQEAYSTSDAYLTYYGGPRWDVTGYVNNIEDRTIYAGSNIRAILPVVYNILRPPRTYGVRLGLHF